MQYNLLDNAYITNNTDISNTTITFNDINSFLTLSGTKSIDVGDIVCLDIDLGYRIKANGIRYYFSETSVTSGIEIYHKNDDADNFTQLTTQEHIVPAYYYAVLPSPAAPKHIRFLHNVNISGTLIGCQVFNDDSVVDFGTDGTQASVTVFSDYDEYEKITTIPIYNDGSTAAIPYVNLEPQGNDIDDMVFIGTSSSGPWVGVQDNSYVIGKAYDWDSGNVSNLTYITGPLIVKSGQTSGYYITRIFPKTYDEGFNYIYLDVTYLDPENNNSKIAVDEADVTATMEIKSSPHKPFTDTAIRYGRVGFTNDILALRDFYRYDGSIRWTSKTIGTIDDDYAYHLIGSACTYDRTTGECLFYFQYYRNINWYVHFYLIDKEGNTVHSSGYGAYQASALDDGVDFYYMDMVKNGGCWIYAYCNINTSVIPWFDQGRGYYLMLLDNTTHVDVVYVNSDNYIAGMAVDYDSNDVWYCDGINEQVVRMDAGGNILFTTNNLTSLGHIISDPSDGGAYVAAQSGSVIFKLNSSGILISALPFTAETRFSWFDIDMDDSDFMVVYARSRAGKASLLECQMVILL